MKFAVLIIGMFAIASANPDSHRIDPMPKFSPNIKEMPIEHLVQYVPPPHKRFSPKFGKAVSGCGLSTPTTEVDPKIVGGTTAVAHEFPWQAALYIDLLYFCGGSLISDTWVLTAGHCTTGAGRIRILLGAQNKNIDEASQLSITSTTIITHEEYGALFVRNDIGLVSTETPVTFTNAIRPLCLPAFSDSDIGVGVTLTASGWGITSDGGSQPANLQKVSVPSISNNECAQTYGSQVITSDVLCVDTTGGLGTCSGDSGGPLTIAPGGTFVSRGITSFGSSSGCETGLPAGFTRTKYFLQWISDNTGILIDP